MRTGNHAEERGFARTVRADEAADLLFRNIEADVFECRYTAKVLGQLLDFQDPHVVSLPGAPASPGSPLGAPLAWRGGSRVLACRVESNRKRRRKSPSTPSGSNKMMIINSDP